MHHVPFGHLPGLMAVVNLLNLLPALSFSVDKFCLSPFAKLNESGQYAASISIRSGRGRGTHDRVFRFIPCFPTYEEAIRYAADQGRRFVRQTSCSA